MAAISHHTVPEFYLRKFRDPSLAGYKVWQYEKGRPPRAVATRRATAIDHYNTVILSATCAFDSEIVEAALNRYETRAARLFRRIESRDFAESEREEFAKWMSVQMTRVPCFREWILEGVRRDYQLAVSPSYALAHVEDTHFDLFADLEWGFLEAPADASFVTSDNPVYVANEGVVYPLNPKLVLVARELDLEGLTLADAELVGMVNLKTIEGAQTYVYATECLAGLDAIVQRRLGFDNMRTLREA
jgi:hypothetical protein